MKAWEIVAWAYNSALHCPECAEAADMVGDRAEDDDRNEPHPVFASDDAWVDEYCDDCGIRLGV